MNSTCATYFHTGAGAMASDFPNSDQVTPQPGLLLLDSFFPGFSMFSSALYKYSKIDLTLYLPLLMCIGVIAWASQYLNESFWNFMHTYFMSVADVRVDDEIYNMLMAWIANQKFSKKSRHFVANTNLNSRFWFLWREFDDEKEDEGGVEFDADNNPIISVNKGKKQKKIRFTPSFGTHYFFYKKRLVLFTRRQDRAQAGWSTVSEREEISISSFGRDPTIIKDLLDDCRAEFMKNDENRTVIYRGGLKAGTAEPAWTRCVSRISRPFSTVVLDEDVKQSLLTDMRDYLHPYTRRWYSNRGIPYRRGYLLYGPPGTGKSSLSFAIAGYFKLKIYIVSLNSPAMNEENLGTLFTELPKQCVVLLEDIDTAGLTHTREKESSSSSEDSDSKPPVTTLPGTTIIAPSTAPVNNSGRISLSALLNILDGVASQEGRVLIMTTNHIEKLDEALIRPGRVDMTIKFDLANSQMITTIFKSIFATLEGDIPATGLPTPSSQIAIRSPSASLKNPELTPKQLAEEERIKAEAEKKAVGLRKKEEDHVKALGEEFAQLVPGMEFSPAEVQGYLLKHKRAPEKAVEGAREWVEKTKKEKVKKAKGEKKGKKDDDEASEREEEEKLLRETSV